MEALKGKIGMNSHSISKPGEHVLCSLSYEARSALSTEMKKRKSKVDYWLNLTDYTETTLELDTVSICTISSYIEDKNLMATANEVVESQEKKIEELKTFVHTSVESGINNVKNNNFTITLAEKTKLAVDSIDILEIVRRKCLSILGQADDHAEE